MERIIKFRAWDKKIMYYFTLKDLYNEGCEANLMYGEPHLSQNTQMPYDGMPIMQFTGLKDKNGKEIYELDHDQDYNVVAWCGKRNGWSLFTYDHPTKDFIECHCYRCAGNFEIDEGEIEIMGNIYQINDNYDLPMNREPDYNAPDEAERRHNQVENKKLK